MAFFLGLFSIATLFYGIGWLIQTPYLLDTHHDALLSTTVMFAMIGVTHLRKPEQLVYMIPKFMPNARLLVLLSGIAELVLALGLLFAETRVWSAWGLTILLIAIFPANINVAINNLPAPGGLPAKPWYIWSRLVFQPVYIIWIWNAVMA